MPTPQLLYWNGWEAGNEDYYLGKGYIGVGGGTNPLVDSEARGGNWSVNMAGGIVSPILSLRDTPNVAGFHIYLRYSGSTSHYTAFSFRKDGSRVYGLRFDTSSGLVTLRGSSLTSGSPLATGTVSLVHNQWHWICFRLDPDAGKIYAYLNGREDPILEYTGSVDGDLNQYDLLNATGGGSARSNFDNIVLANAEYGRIYEMYAGPSRPDNDFEIVLMAPSVGDDGFSLVNAPTAPSNPSTYLEGTEAPCRAVFGLTALQEPAVEILGIKVMTRVARDGTISAGRCLLNINGTEILGESQGIGGGGEFVSVDECIVPDTTDPGVTWTPSQLSTQIRAGFEFTNGNGGD